MSGPGQMLLATLGAIVSVAYITVAVWWFEVRAKENERHRQRLEDRDMRDIGCAAWSAYMAQHQTGGAHVFRDTTPSDDGKAA